MQLRFLVNPSALDKHFLRLALFFECVVRKAKQGEFNVKDLCCFARANLMEESADIDNQSELVRCNNEVLEHSAGLGEGAAAGLRNTAKNFPLVTLRIRHRLFQFPIGHNVCFIDDGDGTQCGRYRN